jgi:hypothetical protein
MKRFLVVALAVVGILAAGCIMRFGSIYTEGSTSHFVGLASNLSKVDVIRAQVQVDFLDSSNHVLASRIVDPCTRTLQIGMDSPVEAEYNSTAVNHVQTYVQWKTLGHKTVADLDVNDDDFTITTASGEIKIAGTFDANEDLDDVHVCAAMFKSDGTVVKVGSDETVGDVDDGDDAVPFDVTMDSDSSAATFKLWIDGLRGSDPTAPVVVGPVNVSEFATDTGLLDPSTNTADSGTWSHATYAYTDNDQYATVTGTDVSRIYGGYGAKAEVPSGADITGIAVQVDLKATDEDNRTVKIEVSYDDGGHWQALSPATKNITTTSEKTYTFGGSDEDWDHTWTRTELDDSHFLVKITLTADDDTDFSLDWIPVVVYFEE